MFELAKCFTPGRVERAMRYVVWGLVLLLVIVHQDVWYWNDATLVFGFMPITLLFHAGISLSAAVVWYMAIIFCWPNNLEDQVIEATREEQQA